MSRLIAAVYVKDPRTYEDLVLLPGECPAPEIAALVTNPDAWDVPPDDCDPGPDPVPVAVGEPDPTAGVTESEPEQEEAGTGGAKKSPSRRARSSSAS
ncbi:hypothetical protein [Streptomyces sp. NPDC058989]|uniref:hypothetical protein n=1 Tax=Streptomyces sp. NPDC058989 TaxID=3346686 RepID=UPI0036942F98